MKISRCDIFVEASVLNLDTIFYRLLRQGFHSFTIRGEVNYQTQSGNQHLALEDVVWVQAAV